MSFLIPAEILRETTAEQFRLDRKIVSERQNPAPRTFDPLTTPPEVIAELIEIAERLDMGRFARALKAIAARADGDWMIPSFEAFEAMLQGFLVEHCPDGWLWEQQKDGTMLPWVIVDVRHRQDNYSRGPERHLVEMVGVAWGRSSEREVAMKKIVRTWEFEPRDVARRRVDAVLAERGLSLNTPDLLELYRETDKRFETALTEGFARQYRVNGPIHAYHGGSSSRSRSEPVGRRAIHDLDGERLKLYCREIESLLHSTAQTTAVLEVPRHPLIALFDLSTHETYWAHVDRIDLYAYDKSLADKLVLPSSHRDLLDVLTTDIDVFTADFIEGKAAGNIILCKGPAGVGKTLTAEVYAELTEKPLYSVHAGLLGTDATAIEGNLQAIFSQAKRWDCVLLLDEADVFVTERGSDVGRNAIVAEFLRTLERFDGLLFMTTNRPHDIDEAILSRMAAIIDFSGPTPDAARSIWAGLAAQFGVQLPKELVEVLVEDFPQATGRDIKNLLRLSLRIARSRGVDIDREIVRQCSMFRALSAEGAA